MPSSRGPAVFALSSGFMTYPDDAHPRYLELRRLVATSPSTFVLLASLDLETCVAETVRRQVARPFGRGAEREAEVIRQRFRVHAELPARKVETARPVDAIVADMMDVLTETEGAPAYAAGARAR